jgi:DivIVA domain-containing protein
VSENERRQRISSTPRLTPDEVATRAFPTAFRGVSENDVRSFLKRVSEDLVAGREREHELTEKIEQLEARLRTPPPLDEAQLLEVLGEETTRLLRSAREAAADIRQKAEERATRVVHDANEVARRIRQDADDVLGVKTNEAEGVAQGLLEEAEVRATDLLRVADERSIEVRDSAERFAQELRARVEREARSELEATRARGTRLVEEATALRERIIDDLARRRELLTGQLEELRAGRDGLLDAYRVVKRTFVEATDALARVEAHASAGRTATGPDPTDLAETLAGEAEEARAAGIGDEAAAESGSEPATDSGPDLVSEPEPVAETEAPAPEAEAAAPEAEADTEPEVDPVAPAAETEAPEHEAPAHEAPAHEAPAHEAADAETEAVAEPEPVPTLPDVDDVFARLRAGAAEAEANGTAAAAAEPPAKAAKPEAATPTPTPIDQAALVPAVPPSAEDVTADLPDWLAARDTALAPLRPRLVRQLKLAVGNEQNEVLDKIRRQKGRPAATAVLPEVDAQVSSWAAVITSAASEAYRAARNEHGEQPGLAVPDDLATELARTMIEPLRERLVAAIDTAHEPGETSAQVAERIGARYREWKNRAAEASSDDVLVAAYSRGHYDAAPEGTQLTWRTPPAGCCPDCADNALEPTAKGEGFPTGQVHPPAHAGCRCGVTGAAEDTVDLAAAEADSSV